MRNSLRNNIVLLILVCLLDSGNLRISRRSSAKDNIRGSNVNEKNNSANSSARQSLSSSLSTLLEFDKAQVSYAHISISYSYLSLYIRGKL